MSDDKQLTLDSIKAHLEEDGYILTGLDDCIIGVNQDNYLVYSYAQFLNHYTFEGMSMEEAIEWVEYNILSMASSGKFSVVYETEYL